MHPSNLLAALCARIVEEVRMGEALARRLDSAVRRRTPAPITRGSDLAALANLVSAPMVSADALLDAAERLDLWHARFTPLLGQALDFDDDVAIARRHLKGHGTLNSNGAGRLIPQSSSFAAMFGDAPGPDTDPINVLLLHTTYLPLRIWVGPVDCDDTHAPPRPGHRRVDIEVVFRGDDAGLLFPDDDQAIVVGVAPIAELDTDLTITINAADRGTGADDGDRLWYGVENHVPADRIVAALRALAAGGAHIAMLPEMSVASSHLSAMRREIIRLGAGSSLQIVCIGVIEAGGGPTHGRNFVHIYDRFGNLLLLQPKLTRWNLQSADAAARFGQPWSDHLPDRTIYEGIGPGQTISVLDTPQLGRLSVFICADLSRHQPGLWLCNNVVLDWVLAPIMDSSIWVEGGWARRENERLAQISRGRIITGNSITWSHWQNSRFGNHRRPKINNCVVGLLVDGRFDDRRHYAMIIPLDPPLASPATCCESWTSAEWTPLP